jgi:2-succinyl-5-enolpyruvyl-6-hydroxy-3-cyclohexene-1-carboxylate synthase
MEFKIRGNPAVIFGDETDEYIAAARHYGNKSHNLLKHYAQDLGFEYFTASNKIEFDQIYEKFVTPKITNKPILFEIFTNDKEEIMSQLIMSQIEKNTKSITKQIVKNILGESGVNTLKKIIK